MAEKRVCAVYMLVSMLVSIHLSFCARDGASNAQSSRHLSSVDVPWSSPWM